jgi:hypothetical protein
MLRSCAEAVTHHPLATTRRQPLPPSTSFARGDTRRQPSPAALVAVPIVTGATHRLSSSGRASRWVIRWAEPGRTGPYQAQRRARAGATVWQDLQAFRQLEAPETPCFTRERSQVRNPPRPLLRNRAPARFLRFRGGRRSSRGRDNGNALEHRSLRASPSRLVDLRSAGLGLPSYPAHQRRRPPASRGVRQDRPQAAAERSS